jgi:hypothetical protein
MRWLNFPGQPQSGDRFFAAAGLLLLRTPLAK